MYLSALLTSAWLEAEVVPPPFALLGLPYLIASWIWGRLRAMGSAACPGIASWIWDKLRALSFKELLVEEPSADADSEPSFKMPKLVQLKDSMMAYMEERAGQQGEDDKWRTSLAKQSASLAKQVADMKQEQARQGEMLAKELAKVREQQAEQMQLLQEKRRGDRLAGRH